MIFTCKFLVYKIVGALKYFFLTNIHMVVLTDGWSFCNVCEILLSHLKTIVCTRACCVRGSVCVHPQWCSQEYYHLMKEYLAQKVPVDGLGVQGHVQTDTTPDPTMIWVSSVLSSLKYLPCVCVWYNYFSFMWSTSLRCLNLNGITQCLIW